jgi:polynucleotide 5'-hydroxyl-kinase GRC3/NOL9
MEIIPEPEWINVLEELIKYKGITILLGATDSGKSTLAKYLIKEFLKRNLTVSFIDADVGQSALGLPGTISMTTFRSLKDLQEFKPDRIFFVGVLNPAKKIPVMIEGTKRMADISIDEGIEDIIIDTTGLIRGETGKAQKTGKIKALNPAHVIAIERHDELEHILALVKGITVRRLKVSRETRRRSKGKRTTYRERCFREYFKGSSIILIPVQQVECVYKQRQLDAGMIMYVKAGTLVGLNHGEDTIALGIFNNVVYDELNIRTPLTSFADINRIVFGEIDLSDMI